MELELNAGGNVVAVHANAMLMKIGLKKQER